MEQLIDEFVSDVCAGATNETPRSYKSKLRHLQRFLGDEEPTQDRIDEFKKYLLNRKTHFRGCKEVNGPLSRFTIRSVLATTRHFLTWGYKKGHLPPIDLVNIPEPTPDPKAVAGETVTRMLLAVPRVGPEWEQVRNMAVMYCLIDTGARVGCLARLEVANLVLADGYATSLDKRDQWTWLHFNDVTVARIRAWLEVRPTRCPADDLIWTGYRSTGMNREAIRRMLNKLAQAAGVEHYRHNPHSFRHAFAREAILAGATLNQVAEMLGHRGIVVTHKYYARWERKEIKNFHRKFSPGNKLPDPTSS